MDNRYLGSGPYCYANSLTMALGSTLEPGLVEVLTGSPFGMQLLGGRRPLFDPLGWDPNQGLDAALRHLGWTCETSVGAAGGTADEALDRLRAAVGSGPVLVGPVELGLLRHQPGMTEAIGADHFMLVTGVEGDLVRFHDPHGHPFATLPAAEFAAAWRGETIEYTDAEYTMRSDFRRVHEVDPLDALWAALPDAVRWLDGRPELAPPNSLGGRDAALAFAEQAEAGLSPDRLGELQWFAVRVGARRLADAAWWLGQIGAGAASAIAERQARLVGGLQYPVVAGDGKAIAASLRELAPTYGELRDVLGGW